MNELIAQLKEDVAAGEKVAGKKPSSLVLGALGRCGSGAVDLLEKIDCSNILKWDLPETKDRPGPYPEIVESDIFVNCVSLRKNKLGHTNQVSVFRFTLTSRFLLSSTLKA